MKLDKSKPYGEILGSRDGSKYDQNGYIFDRDGNLLGGEVKPEIETKIEQEVTHEEPKKRGRPAKQ